MNLKWEVGLQEADISSRRRGQNKLERSNSSSIPTRPKLPAINYKHCSA